MGIVVRGIDKHLKQWHSYRAYFELDGRIFPEEKEVPVSFELSLHIWKMRHQIKVLKRCYEDYRKRDPNNALVGNGIHFNHLKIIKKGLI